MRYFDNELTIRNNDAISTILNHIALTMFAADDEELTAEEFFERWIKNKPTIDEDCVRFAFLGRALTRYRYALRLNNNWRSILNRLCRTSTKVSTKTASVQGISLATQLQPEAI